MATNYNDPVINKSSESHYRRWHYWPVSWSGIVIGILATVSLTIVFGLFAVAIGLDRIDSDNRLVNVNEIQRGTLIFAVCTAFFSFVIGGWVASKIAGILHSEPAMAHGAVVWCGAVPLIALLLAAGAGGSSTNWFNGLRNSTSGSVSPYEVPYIKAVGASDYEKSQYDAAVREYVANVKKWREDSPKVARNAALCSASALLLALIGSVIGGWMACGEPMSLTYKRAAQAVKA